jgi:microcin C transport system permease protein
MKRWRIHPITRRRIQRFRQIRYAWWAFWLLAGLYALSLAAELLSNDRPLAVRFEGRWVFPAFQFVPEDFFLDNGRFTRPDYKQLAKSDLFRGRGSNRMWRTPVPHGPREIIPPEEIELPDVVTVEFQPVQTVAALYLDEEESILRALGAGALFGRDDRSLRGMPVGDLLVAPAGLSQAAALRFANREADAWSGEGRTMDGREVRLSMPAHAPRRAAPRRVRVRIEADLHPAAAPAAARVGADGAFDGALPPWWESASAEDRRLVRQRALERLDGAVLPLKIETAAGPFHVTFAHEEVRYPFRPVRGHPLGLDSSGRDVLARMIYGLRTSMTFGLLLVTFTMAVGTVMGALQGYHGGLVDMFGQRLIEVWQALPFLYILILVGSVFGRNLALLMFCYGLFNWIGISYYMRAEFLRLRRLPFVEAAQCMGLRKSGVIFRHILPNALVPVLTFFPFSLVSAIGILAALDFLGFGVPPPTPSWGEMLAQAQEYVWAWWLILYPVLALFVVMLLGVFIGEGARSALDPRQYSRLE